MTNEERRCPFCGQVYSTFEVMIHHMRFDHEAHRQANAMVAYEMMIDQKVAEFSKVLEEALP